jgi:hypothetical protein
VHIGAHEHSLERNYPVYDFGWDPSLTGQAAYTDFNRTVHLLIGNAGCPENQDAWQPTGNPFSALRANIYGYAKITAINATHLHYAAIDAADGSVADEMYFIKHSHGSFNASLTAAAKEAAEAAEAGAGVSTASLRGATAAASKKAYSHYTGHSGELPSSVVKALAALNRQHSHKAV